MSLAVTDDVTVFTAQFGRISYTSVRTWVRSYMRACLHVYEGKHCIAHENLEFAAAEQSENMAFAKQSATELTAMTNVCDATSFS